MFSEPIEIDPEGDLLIVVPFVLTGTCDSSSESSGHADDEVLRPDVTESSSDRSCAPSFENTPDAAEDPALVTFKVSTKHLTLASARAKKMFDIGFIESQQDAVDGYRKWRFDAIFDIGAFETVLFIIHGRTKNLPEQITLQKLADVSAVVDDLQCADSVWFFAKKWLRDLDTSLAEVSSKELFEWILVAYVFNEADIFERSTRTVIRKATSSVEDFGLPIIPKILEDIEQRRQELILHLLSRLNAKLQEILTSRNGCPGACAPMILGSLFRQMETLGISPVSANGLVALQNRTLDSIAEKLAGFRSPPIFVESYEIPEEHLQFWDKREEEEYGYGYGRPSMRKGTKQQDIDEEIPNELPQRRLPQRLVHHTCSLETHIKPILNDLTLKTKGLKLADYIN